jgi:tetratricopeptide (TPR) repeat protein/opacity protein-like surface antigen
MIGILTLFSLMCIFLLNHIAYADTCENWVAKVVSVEGSVQIKKSADSQWVQANLGDLICSGYLVRANANGRAAVQLVNGPVLRIDQHTNLVFNGVKEESSFIDLINGIVNFFSRWPRSLKVSTPFVNGTVEGTEFLVRVDDNGTFLSIFEGRVVAENKAGSVTLTSGQSAVAKAGQAPVLQTVVRPRDAVQWALYYPTVIEKYPEGLKDTDPRFYTCRAASLLRVGRVEEAKTDIEQTLRLDPQNSLAFSLQSIIAVTQNEKEKALTLATKAVQADKNSAAAHIAMSYAQQARFDLNGALNSLKEAVKAEPENALAWARRSEIQLSFGKLDEALEAANKAVELNPNIARTQTVLGFAYLTQVKMKESISAFEKAIELDQAAPLPRLGLGLAKIRKGCLEEGRKDIEIAVSLDPDNSLLRSYLGKAYYEEKQDKMANEQYGLAKEFDPKDPTPFFYEAIKKQTENRPVEALEEMQKAIELNDNRAIYRSKFLLDADLAARSASLGRIYSDLGFQDLALVEGLKSVNTDPVDFSGHRFLADSYSTLPRHEIARVSELLQSQLLQPININPVQPHLAESNLFILEGAGPSDPSFNEFNPLFNRNRLGLQLSGVIGGNSTFGDEVVASGIYDKFSISAGQFHYETDGFRENNDLKEDIYNVFAQYSLSPQTSVQAEYRHKEVDEGDLSLRFNPEMFTRDLRNEYESDSVRFGVHHSFSPNSDILVSATYQDLDGVSPSPPPAVRSDSTGYGAEAQHLYRTEQLKLITGVGYFTVDNKLEIINLFSSRSDTDHTNLYLYSYVNYPKQVTWIFGASGNFFKEDFLNLEKDQFNPKFGFIWNPLPKTTIRAAVFRVLKRNLLNDQTLEPTQVAGFNQFYDDFDGTDAWRYGIGIDQKFTEALYAGAEFSKRDLKVSGQQFDENSGTVKSEEFDLDELLGRAYVNWSPHPWLALKGEYQYEKFKRPEDFMLGEDLIFRLQTHRLSCGINFFHPTGLFAKLKPSYVYQHGEFYKTFTPPTTERGADHFWVFDASIGFRLPKRFGIFTIEARNLFDEKFNFQDTDPSKPRISPERLVLAKLTLSF